MGALALISAALPTLPSGAAGEPTLQVVKEINTALGGDAVLLTARLSDSTLEAVEITFDVFTGPAAREDVIGEKSCRVESGQNACEVSIAANEQGSSLVRAWIGDENAAHDRTEGRLSSSKSGLLEPDAADDCQVEDQSGGLPVVGGGDSLCRPNDVAPIAGERPEPDGTDVVQIDWTTFTDARLDCDDSDPTDGEDAEYQRAPSERTERYTCTLTTLDGRPIDNAYIDGERIGGDLGLTTTAGKADFNDFCRTGDSAPGTCQGTLSVPENGALGFADVCFWAEASAAEVRNDAFKDTGVDNDGGGCDSEPFDKPETPPLDVTDVVRLDIDNPRASGLDVTPESQTKAQGSTFTVEAKVFDQFGDAFTAAVPVGFEVFAGSPVDNDGNTPSSPDARCDTGSAGTCTVTFGPQNGLGFDLACAWIGTAPADDKVIGDGRDGSCGDEIPTDSTADDGAPFPTDDALDMVRFVARSQPAVAVVSPAQERQGMNTVLRVTGAGFDEGARITLGGDNVKVGLTRYGNSTLVEADVTIGPGASVGPRDVTVTNPDKGTVTCAGCFRIVGQGYWMVATDGGIFNFGDAAFAGSTGDQSLNQPIVTMAATPSGQGYWLAASDGGIFAFGDAPFLGSAGNLQLAKPVVAMAATPSGQGYWLVGSDGGVFPFGDARFYGSTARLTLAKPIIGITATPNGRGYWLVASDGGIFGFGEARFFGSTGDIRLNQPIVAMSATRSGKGYWLVAADGGIFSYGDAVFHGGTGDLSLNKPIVGSATTPSGNGYWLVASDGGIFGFGDAGFHGSTGNLSLNRPIVGLAARR
jgi:hypothetical protein